MAPNTGQKTLDEIAQSITDTDTEPISTTTPQATEPNTDTETETTTCMFIPDEHGVPEYDAITTQSELRAYTKAYVLWAIDYHDMEIATAYIRDYNITTTKREAASVKRLKIPDRFVGTIGISPIDWGAVDEEMSTAQVEYDNAKEIKFRFSWRAFQEFDEDTWKEVIKHELVHAEEFHKYGDTNHRSHFKARAREINAAIECKNFTEYEYKILCSECGKFVAGRHRRSKVVKSAENEDGAYTANCCNAVVTLAE